MPTKDREPALARAGYTYKDIGARLGTLPGQAYLIATGLPADGRDILPVGAPADRDGLPGSIRHLANPPTSAPTSNGTALTWPKGRGAADKLMRAAAARRTAEPPAVRGHGDRTDVFDMLGPDHRQVRYLQEQPETVPGVRAGGSMTKQEVPVSPVDMILVRLSRHETVEAGVLGAWVRSALDEGDGLGDQTFESAHEKAEEAGVRRSGLDSEDLVAEVLSWSGM